MDVIETLEKINDFLNQFLVFKSMKVLIAFYTIIIVLTMIGIAFRIGRLYLTIFISGQEFPNINKGTFQKQWDNVQVLINSNENRNWKVAILESARMLEEILRITQHPGETLGERLNGMVEIQLRNLGQVKEANKIKNRIVQEGGFEISKEEAQKIVAIFGNALHFFEVIELESD